MHNQICNILTLSTGNSCAESSAGSSKIWRDKVLHRYTSLHLCSWSCHNPPTSIEVSSCMKWKSHMVLKRRFFEQNECQHYPGKCRKIIVTLEMESDDPNFFQYLHFFSEDIGCWKIKIFWLYCGFFGGMLFSGLKTFIV